MMEIMNNAQLDQLQEKINNAYDLFEKEIALPFIGDWGKQALFNDNVSESFKKEYVKAHEHLAKFAVYFSCLVKTKITKNDV